MPTVGSCFFIFQSTLPQGERRQRQRGRGKYQHFNPRSHKGSDVFFFVVEAIQAIFQSTLPQGERQQAAVKKYGARKFQSTLPQGERPCLIRFLQ